jgi:hypothetical protein
MKSFLLTVLLCTSAIGFGQTHQNGIIIPNDFNKESFNRYAFVFTPKDGFMVYDAPNGNNIGTALQIDKPNLPLTEMYAVILKNGNKPIYKYFDKGLAEVGYEIFTMKFYNAKDGYVRIFSPKSHYWIKVSDIENAGFTTSNWQDFLVHNTKILLGYYANDPGLNLRESPDKNAKILKTLRGDLFEIELQPESNGNWNKVKVTKYHEHPCKGNLSKQENIEYILEGWIKTVDDSGLPNIRYYARGC